MKEESRSPIRPTPQVLWSEFRLRVVPVLCFAALAAVGFLLWSRYLSTQTFAGLGEGARASVASPQGGWLQELKVAPYQLVNQGDPIAVVQPVDPQVPLDFLQAELQLARLEQEPSLAAQNAMNYERVRVEMLRLRVEVAETRINLRRAENELQRNQRLHEQRLLSDDLYDLSLQTRDALAAEVGEKAKAVEEMEGRLKKLQLLGDPDTPGVDDKAQALLSRLEKARTATATNWGPVTLRAPISGMVSYINRQPGEYVLEGEPFVAVHSLWSDRVVCYLRQPHPLDPDVVQKVRITTRTAERQQFWTTVSHVGAQVEVITNTLAFVRQGALVDVGLPVIVNLPPETRIRPGEVVDMWVEPVLRKVAAGQPN